MASSFLKVTAEGYPPKEIFLTGKKVTIGSSRQATIHVDSPALAKVHAMLSSDSSYWKVISFGFEKDIYINGVRLLQRGNRILANNDIITIGDLGNPLFQAHFVTQGQHGQGRASKRRKTERNVGRNNPYSSFAGEVSSTSQNSSTAAQNREDRNFPASVDVGSLGDLIKLARRDLMALQSELNKIAANEAAQRPVLDTLKSELRCSLCMEMFIKATVLNCSHCFCKFCIDSWEEQMGVCPECETEIKSKIPVSVLDNCVEEITRRLGREEKQPRSELIARRSQIRFPFTM